MKGCIPLSSRISAFEALGSIMRESAGGHAGGKLAGLIEDIHLANPWFTPDNVKRAFMAYGEKLTSGNLMKWLSRYPEIGEERKPLTVGVVMAGNIPLVGFHDFLCVLLSGNRLMARISSRDTQLMQSVAGVLTEIEPNFMDYIALTEETLSGFDKVIATGSDNTSRYFEYYFRSFPSIIRRNRTSIAIIDGTETDTELMLLAEDVFSYFGLGCRNVSKLYLPEGYDLGRLTSLWHDWESLRSHNKYAANYDHYKAVMIINRQPFTDTGFVLLSMDPSLTPPVAVLHYEYYSSGEQLAAGIEAITGRIQCICGHGHIPFGKTQKPELWDYADDVDTIAFLLKKN